MPTRVIASVSSCPLERLGVPTQIKARSEFKTASSVAIVVFNRPALTTSARSSLSPGSTIGDTPLLIIATFSLLISTPTTACPALAKQAAVTHPTYPIPITLTRSMLYHLLTFFFEFPGHLRPRVPLLHQ